MQVQVQNVSESARQALANNGATIQQKTAGVIILFPPATALLAEEKFKLPDGQVVEVWIENPDQPAWPNSGERTLYLMV